MRVWERDQTKGVRACIYGQAKRTRIVRIFPVRIFPRVRMRAMRGAGKIFFPGNMRTGKIRLVYETTMRIVSMNHTWALIDER